jgi:hypothetical protein
VNQRARSFFALSPLADDGTVDIRGILPDGSQFFHYMLPKNVMDEVIARMNAGVVPDAPEGLGDTKS